MNFSIEQSISILERTPGVIEKLLSGLADEWIFANEGGETWSPFDTLGHLIHGERTDWIARLKIILSDSDNRKFTPFDRFAQFDESKGKSLKDLIFEFKNLREQNIATLKSKNISVHPIIHPSPNLLHLFPLRKH